MSSHIIPFLNIKIKIHPKSCKICSYGICSKGPKNEFETAVVNEPSVFQPLKFYCICSVPSLELSVWDGSNGRSQSIFLWNVKANFA